MDKIVDYLKQLELSDIEAKLYLALLKTGTTGVRELAKSVGIKRTTAYIYVDQLVEKGLVIKLVKSSKKQVAANNPPESLKYLVKQKLEHAEATKTQFPNMLKEITGIHQGIKITEEAEIKYYKGKNGVKTIYEEALQSNELRSYVNIAEVLALFPENAQLFDNAFKRNPGMRMFEICEDSQETRSRIISSGKKHFYKILPKDMQLTSQDVLIYQDKIAIIYLKESPSGVVLHNTDIYNNFKLLFDFLWKTLPQM